MAFVYEALDSLDFERLCADIVGRKTGTELSVYARGRDGGVDASDFHCDDPNKPRIVVQAKHYFRSTYSSLKSALEEDVNKLKSFAAGGSSLYLMTSRSLSRNNKNELKRLGTNVGFANCEVWGEEDITSYLEQEENAETLRRHFKLWLTHTGVLEELFNRDVFIDTEYYLSTAEEDVKHFVPTDAFSKAQEAMKDSHVVMLIGEPGTGKSVLSEMLALEYAAEGYAVRYTTSSDVRDVTRSLCANKEVREIVVLDDFLGGNILELHENQLKAVYSLVHHVRSASGKRVVLNSRTSILNEAKRREASLGRDRGFYGIPTIDTSHISEVERARIMVSLMRRRGVPASFVQSFLKPSRYMESWCLHLVKHQNFNPRIVDYACRETNIKMLKPNEFPLHVERLLKNPVQVWDSEFSRLTASDRCLLFVLYTMPRGMESARNVKAAYERRVMSDASIDVGTESFEQSLSRLNDSLVQRAVRADESVGLAAANPSINDYIAGELKSSDALCGRMMKGAAYLDQIKRVVEANQSDLVKSEVRDALRSGALLNVSTLGERPHVLVLDILLKLEMFDDVSEMAIACVDACLRSEGRFYSHEPLGFVGAYIRWASDQTGEIGPLGKSLCDGSRLSQLVNHAADLGDLDALVTLCEMTGKTIFEGTRGVLFADAFDHLLYEQVSMYCVDHMVEIADETGIQPYEVGDYGWYECDDVELDKLRDYCTKSLCNQVDEILDYAEYWSHEALKRNWSQDEAALIATTAVESYFAVEDFDFLTDQNTSHFDRQHPGVSSVDESIERLFQEYVDSQL